MSIDKKLLDTFRLDGRWALPGNPVEKGVPGHLQFDPQNGIQLSTESPFERPKNGVAIRPVPYDIIHGVTRSAQLVTLVQCTGGAAGVNASSNVFVMPGSYKAIFLIVGELVSSPADLKYRAVSATYHNLEEFVGISGIRADGDPPRLWYEDKSPFLSQLENFRIEIANHGSYDFDFFHQASLNERARVDVSLADDRDEIHIEEFLRGPLASVHYLLQFALGRRVPMLELMATTARTERELDGRRVAVPVQVFFAQRRPLPVPRRQSLPKFLFTLTTLGSECTKYLNLWHKSFGSLRDAMDFYFSFDPVADTDVSQHHHFLNVVNAFEALHRAVGKKQLLWDEAGHQTRLCQAINPAAKSSLRKWIKGRLRHSNEVSLEQRIRDALSQVPQQLCSVFGDKAFARDVATTRNALTHHTETLKAEAITSVHDLWIATTRIRLLIQIEFLRQMGIINDLLPEIISRSTEFKILSERASSKDA